MSQLENTNHCGGVNCPFEYSCVDGCMNPKVRQGTVAELAVTHLQTELSKAQERVNELEDLLDDLLRNYELGKRVDDKILAVLDPKRPQP